MAKQAGQTRQTKSKMTMSMNSAQLKHFSVILRNEDTKVPDVNDTKGNDPTLFALIWYGAI